MNKPIVLRVLCAAVVLAALASAPESALAQRGGGFHGGGGGFHGGGGWGGGHYGGYHGSGYSGGHGGYYGGYHGGGYSGGHGGYYGGYHGGGYYGGHGGYYGGYHGGGYYGWRGGYWGYTGYGYGWGFGVSIGFGPYWGYGYPYGYTVWVPPYDPYYYSYPYYYPGVPVSYPAGYSVTIYRTGTDVAVNSSVESPTPVAGPPVLRATPDTNSPAMNYAAYRPATAPRQRDATNMHPSNYRPPQSAAQPLPPLRSEVQNVIQALRGMPPDAREREIASGRYSNLSPQELKLARYGANLPPMKASPAVGAPLQSN